jgi:hypothetical protein
VQAPCVLPEIGSDQGKANVPLVIPLEECAIIVLELILSYFRAIGSMGPAGRSQRVIKAQHAVKHLVLEGAHLPTDCIRLLQFSVR